MKKNLCLWIAVIAIAGLAAFGCKKDRSNKVKGPVISINAVTHEVVIKDKYTDTSKTIVVNENEIPMLKAGEIVKVKVKPGTNIAESVKPYGDKARKKDDQEE